jgi:hypothetical protein
MKAAIILFASLGLSVNVQAENLIRALLNSVKSKEDISKKYKGVEKIPVGNSRFFYYKLERTDGNTKDSVTDNTQPAVTHVPEVENHPDNKPIERVIDKYQVLDEVSTDAVKDGRRVAYGSTSPLRDDKVIEAWKEAEAAQRRLDEHRSYMERLRQNRERVANSKRVTSGINQTSGGDQ